MHSVDSLEENASVQDDLLKKEAFFADRAYSPYMASLEIQPGMFRRYSNPKEKWDHRQLSAMLLGDVKGKRLLDYGCGMGEEAAYFAKLGAQVTAIDISPVGVEITQKRAQHNDLPIQSQVADVTATGLASGSFDVVHGFGILHHVGLEKGLREVYRLMAPGARAVFVEHMSNSPVLDRLRKQVGQADKDYSEDERPLRWSEVQDYMRQHPGMFRNLQMQPYALLYRLRRKHKACGSLTAQRMDYLALTALPALRHLAGGVVLAFDK